ncbi:hypothetical protein ABW19_dt0202200 [Dactylella cylindrospora]|nr:hypothetical protein ABW19_dt0202200 [Dactylella cylindrospora]
MLPPSPRLPTNLLLLALAIQSTSATPAPIWNRILSSLEHIAPNSWLHPQSPSQSPLDSSDPNGASPGTIVTTHLPAQTTTIHATTYTPLPLPPPWSIRYPEDFDDDDDDDDEESLKKRQCTNSGVGNDGCNNSGNYNCGNYNSGNNNNGDYNSGNNNVGDYNSGNGNNGNYQSGNGGSGGGVCGNVVISQSQAWVYPAPSTVVYPQVYTSYVVYAQQPATTVIYQQPQVVPIVAQETYAPRGCAYWEALGYQCSSGRGWDGMRSGMGIWMAVGGVFWGVWMVVM